ncbi:MAG: rhomboid family intramembrane serine protease [Lewinellaceae bacterium]|jgi:membrane associated rhomboid family serine protease|nr:rhomboid family intramembrane serine protease [Lewinellaceae bacterium]
MLFPIGDDNIEGGHPAVFSYLFLVLNTGIFLLQVSMPHGVQASFVETYGAIPAEISRGADWETLASSMFLHGSWLHLLGNMLYLWIFADNIEAVVGNFRFLLFYLAGGIAAGLIQVAVSPDSGVPCIGASGAISAVMGAYIVMFPKSQVRMLFIFFFVVFYIPAWVFLGFWFIQQLSSGYGVLGMTDVDAGGVAWWAHIGGFVFGLLTGAVFRRHYVTERHIRFR